MKNRTTPLKALIIEDNDDDAWLVIDHLAQYGFNVSWRKVDTADDLRLALSEPWDIIYSDYSLPYLLGNQVLAIIREFDTDIPVIFVSGTIGEETAVGLMKAGAQDYVMKSNLARLAVATEREIMEAHQRQQRKQAEQMLQKLSLVVEQAADSVYITDPSGKIEYVNPAFERLTGYKRDEALGQTPALTRSGQENSIRYRYLWKTLRSGGVFRGVLLNRDRFGKTYHEEKTITPLKDAQGNITHYVSTGRDISEKVIAEQAQARLVAILEATTDLVLMFAADGQLCYLNKSGLALLKLTNADRLSELKFFDLFPSLIVEHSLRVGLKAAMDVGTWSSEVAIQATDGSETPVSLVILSHFDSVNRISYFSAIARNISERMHFEAELKHQSTHDPLTQLPNRLLLDDRLTTEIERARRLNCLAAVLFLDVNNFKRINDSLGHTIGDQLMQQIALRLVLSLDSDDTVARYGGDEFAIVVGDLLNIDHLQGLLTRIRTEFERPFTFSEQVTYVTLSIGIAVYPYDGLDVDDLLRNAGTAMYWAKASGSNHHRYYAPKMNARSHERLMLETELRDAIKNNEFVLYYQAQMAIERNKIIGAEGLLRWRHPQRGLIPPADFIPLLEETGLIVSVGEWVIRQACKDFLTDELLGLRVSVNVSGVQFNDADFLAQITKLITEESLPAQALELELTENIVINDPLATAEILKTLHGLGMRIAIDDFGTGYSSLAYLKSLPLDVLKIDQSFIRDLTEGNGNRAIVEASISLGKKLGLEIVAEGVETLAQLEILRQLDCEYAQGYYIGKPVPKAEFIGLVIAINGGLSETST